MVSCLVAYNVFLKPHSESEFCMVTALWHLTFTIVLQKDLKREYKVTSEVTEKRIKKITTNSRFGVGTPWGRGRLAKGRKNVSLANFWKLITFFGDEQITRTLCLC